jgi:hypothetical protein
MGKPYEKQFFFSGSRTQCGTMICSSCNKPILNEAHDWMAQKVNKNWDWEYHTFHRNCRTDQSGWQKLEKAAKIAADAKQKTMELLRNVAKEIGVSDPILFADLAAEALGEPDLDSHYFNIYGSC